MNHMFSSCISLENLDLSSFDTSNVNNISHMFDECISLTRLNISHFNTRNVTSTYYLFSNCKFTFLDIYSWTISDEFVEYCKIKYLYSKYIRHTSQIAYKYDPVYGMYKLIK